MHDNEGEDWEEKLLHDLLAPSTQQRDSLGNDDMDETPDPNSITNY